MTPVSLRHRFLHPLWLQSCALLLFLLTGFGTSVARAGSSVLTIEEAVTTYQLAGSLAVLEDKTRSLSIDEARQLAHQGAFAIPENPTKGYGFAPSAFWGHVRIDRRTSSEAQWYLELNYAPMQDIDVYVVDPGGVVRHFKGGSRLRFADRPYAFHTHVFPLSLVNGDVSDLFVRIDGDSSKSFPLTLMRGDAFTQSGNSRLGAIGLYVGVLSGLILYNLFVLMTVRESSYVWYILFLCGFIFFVLTFKGLGQQLLWPDAAEAALKFLPVSMAFNGFFACLFTSTFIDTKRNFPRLHIALVIAISGGFIGIFIPLVLPYRLAIVINTVYVAAGAMVLITVAVLSVLQGNQSARYYLGAWVVLIFGLIITPLRALGILPDNVFTENSLLVGSATEAVLLSFALAARIRVMKAEKERVQEALIHQTELALVHQEMALKNEKEAVDALRRMDKLKDEFLANTSHELRTPLNGIIGLAEASLHQASHALDPEIQANLGMIVTSGRRLGSLVNDILDFSKLRHEDIVLSCKLLDVRSLADVVIALSKPMLLNKPVVIDNEMPLDLPFVWADENRLQQIFHNLVGNAIKFTREGRVTVSARVENSRVVVSVHDTGIGIPEERIESVFESFNQGDGSVSREFGGTGLGLTITRKLVELHGGVMQVSSVVGQGSVFSFDLAVSTAAHVDAIAEGLPVFQCTTSPLMTAGADAAGLRDASDLADVISGDNEHSNRTQERASNGVRILVVDDEPINRQVLRAQLGSAGFTVCEASDGQEALGILQSASSFDLILLDVMMPRLSGFDTCAALRKEFPTLVLPVIFLTAKAQTEDVLAGFSSGGNDYLVKPFSRDELLARIRIHLELVTTHRIIQQYSKGLEDKVAQRTRDLVDAQQALVIKQKQAALGVLTAGVAHEINNPNNFVQVGVQNTIAWKERFEAFLFDLLAEDGDPELRSAFGAQLDKLQEQLGLIATGSKRIDTIVKGLHVITRVDEAEQQEADVLEGLLQTVELIKPAVSKGITFIVEFEAKPRVPCWPAELNQVFMNVLMNSVHAIDGREDSGQGTIRISSSIHGDSLAIVISDDGVGMTDDVLIRACDPFFTTRDVGSGSGLGLSISRDIVARHGGELLLSSVLKKGTDVRITLPLSV